ncbi:MAG: LicD family protein [Lactobacillaceae bacterium]
MHAESDLLRKAQLEMLTALKELDSICRANNIGYWLDAGTLLGAVRHGGFIPWDDDIDVCMDRENYNKFLEVCKVHLNKNRFFLQTPLTDKYYNNINIPCKIRINDTILVEGIEIEQGFYDERSHHGIYIDIFPYDKYSTNVIKRKYLERFLGLIFKVKTISYRKSVKGVRNNLAKVLGPFIPKKLLLRLIKPISDCMSKKVSYVYGAGVETPFTRAYFTDSEIFPLQEIKFEDGYFMCPNNVAVYLKKMFGASYMDLPPEEKRVWHHARIEINHD